MNKDDLYIRLVCALTHRPEACDSCKKCGEDAAECRMNLVRELAKYMNEELPWNEGER